MNLQIKQEGFPIMGNPKNLESEKFELKINGVLKSSEHIEKHADHISLFDDNT